jgi:hypothetical protein
VIDIFPRPGIQKIRLTGEEAEALASDLKRAEAEFSARRRAIIQPVYQKHAQSQA